MTQLRLFSFLLTFFVGTASIVHAQMERNTAPTKSIHPLTMSAAKSDLKTPQFAMNNTISRDQINHFTVVQNHPESIPHDPTTTASQDDVTIACYFLNDDNTQNIQGPLKLSAPINSPLYKHKCDKHYPSCGSDCLWEPM